MEKLPFLIWMLGYPITQSLSSFLLKDTVWAADSNSTTKGLTAITYMVVYIWIAVKLYK